MAEQPIEPPTGETAEQRYRRVRDREPLETLPSGLMIVRSMKHEPVDLAGLQKRKLPARTNKRSGSKFLSTWTLTRYVEWITEQVEQLGWTAGTENTSHDVEMDNPIGVSYGQYVSIIRLVTDGRHVHAYPVRPYE